MGDVSEMNDDEPMTRIIEFPHVPPGGHEQRYSQTELFADSITHWLRMPQIYGQGPLPYSSPYVFPVMTCVANPRVHCVCC